MSQRGFFTYPLTYFFVLLFQLGRWLAGGVPNEDVTVIAFILWIVLLRIDLEVHGRDNLLSRLVSKN